jgi:chromosomal replication initiation ATPase DnaA
MNYAPVQQINTARHIARSAQRMIKDKTGLRVSLLMEPKDDIFKTPWKMLEIVAEGLEMSPACYSFKSRMRDIVELRFIGALLLRRHFPAVTLQQIAAFFGGQDHSSILSGIARANDLIYVSDERFIQKYYTALKKVNTWLRNER